MSAQTVIEPDRGENGIIPLDMTPDFLFSLTPQPRCGAANPALRLFLEAVTLPPVIKRGEPPQYFAVQLKEITRWLWPTGWAKTRNWPTLYKAAGTLHNLQHPSVRFQQFPRGPEMDRNVYFRIVTHGERPQQGYAVNRATLRQHGAASAKRYRAYVTICYLLDRHGKVNGKTLHTTIPEVRRNKNDEILNRNGQVVTYHNGTPVKRWDHKAAIRTGKRIPNPAAERFYPILSPNQIAQMFYGDVDFQPWHRREALKMMEEFKEAKICQLVPRRKGFQLMPATIESQES